MIEKNKKWNHILFGIEGIILDFISFYFAFVLITRGKPKIFALGIFFFYSIKILATQIEKWPNPVPRLMDYPGVPSFVVRYKKSNDEYPSGHTGYALLFVLAF